MTPSKGKTDNLPKSYRKHEKNEKNLQIVQNEFYGAVVASEYIRMDGSLDEVFVQA